MQENLKITFEQLIKFVSQQRFSALDVEDHHASDNDTVDFTITGTLDPRPTADRTIDIRDLLDK